MLGPTGNALRVPRQRQEYGLLALLLLLCRWLTCLAREGAGGPRREHGKCAHQYLADGHYSLGQVADLLGFVDQSNFFRTRKRWFGQTPTQYRQRPTADRVPS